VFLNGVNLVRGQDYTATNGTSVGSLTALVASDVVEVFAFVPFNIANALTVSTVDAKGDLLVGTGADAVGRLAVGTNGQLLSAASGETSGLKWANGGLTLIKTETFSAVASQSFTSVFSATYNSYRVIININTLTSFGTESILLRLRSGSTNNSSNNIAGNGYYLENSTTTTVGNNRTAGLTQTGFFVTYGPLIGTYAVADLINPFETQRTGAIVMGIGHLASNDVETQTVHGLTSVTTSYDGFSIVPLAGTMTGSASVYGYNK
jgi:hypothetical protein